MSYSFKQATTIKQRARELIDQLPDDASWEDLAEAIALVADVEAGLSESDAGLGVETARLREDFGLRR